ncbi:hypothetical protein ACTQ1N_03905 [Porcincola sp. LCP21S3_C12]|uniref:hypothetical protein n=1 Tax=Porcincola sp. LCP21S3_C12 TaxID=3438798 RepID=UPI003F96209A
MQETITNEEIENPVVVAQVGGDLVEEAPKERSVKKEDNYWTELFKNAKDDMNYSKKVIQADINSRKVVHEQNDATIKACEKELQRDDLTKEEREGYLQEIIQCRQDSVKADAESREFEKEEMGRMHAWPWVFVGLGVVALGLLGYSKFTPRMR